MSPNQINVKLIRANSSLRQITQHVNKDSKSIFICIDCNSTIESTWSNIREGKGCYVCADRLLSVDKINQRLANANKSIICLSVENWSKATFKCMDCGLTRVAIVSNALKPGRKSCPACAKRGFDPLKLGWLYLLKRPDGLLKIGVTNNLDQRLSRMSSVGAFELVTAIPGSGEQVWKTERLVKNLDLNWYSGDPFEGSTECFWPS